jgi:Rod binding domain-containing protein
MDSSALLTLQAAQTQTQTAQQSRISSAMTATGSKNNAKLGLDFETMCLTNLMTPMFEGLKSDGPFGGGEGEEAMKSFYIGAIAKEMALRGGVGISDMMQQQLLKTQEMGQDMGVPA